MRMVEQLKSDNDFLRKQNQELLKQINNQSEEIKKLRILSEKQQAQLEELLRVLYGKKSEKKPKPESEDKSDDHVSNGTPESSLSSSSKDSHIKEKPKRKRLPESLPRIVVKHELQGPELACQCGRKCHMIGKEITEQLEYLPASLCVKEHRRYKYACQHGCCVKIAPLPPQPIEKGIPGPGLLTEILINKYQDALPLYRQSLRFKRHEIILPESTLCDWVKESAKLLEPIVLQLKQNILSNRKIHTDDTPVPVLMKEGKAKQGRLWVYVADGKEGRACTVYDYTATRSQTAPQNFLQGYKGFIQADAYPGYNKLYQTGDVVEVGCLAHVRRKFYVISELAKGDSVADEALEIIGRIYEVERECRALSSIERYYYRKRHLKKLYRSFYNFLKQQKAIVLANTPLAKAINYAMNHWKALQNVLADGILEVDNNTAERAIKPVVIGRKNWLFAGSHEGGKRAAIIYSIIESAKQNQLNVFEYLCDVMTRLPSQMNSKLYELLPYHWKPT